MIAFSGAAAAAAATTRVVIQNELLLWRLAPRHTQRLLAETRECSRAERRSPTRALCSPKVVASRKRVKDIGSARENVEREREKKKWRLRSAANAADDDELDSLDLVGSYGERNLAPFALGKARARTFAPFEMDGSSASADRLAAARRARPLRFLVSVFRALQFDGAARARAHTHTTTRFQCQHNTTTTTPPPTARGGRNNCTPSRRPLARTM